MNMGEANSVDVGCGGGACAGETLRTMNGACISRKTMSRWALVTLVGARCLLL